MSRIANYCAQCGGALLQKLHSGRIRPYCQACQQPTFFDPKVAVIIFALRAGKVLLIQRAIDPGAGKWALPAGFVDYDEAPEDAAIREVREETGLQVVIRELLAVFPKRDEGLADIAIAYRGEIIAGEAKAGDDAAAVGFFAADQLPPLAFFPSNALVAQWRAGELAPQS